MDGSHCHLRITGSQLPIQNGHLLNAQRAIGSKHHFQQGRSKSLAE